MTTSKSIFVLAAVAVAVAVIGLGALAVIRPSEEVAPNIPLDPTPQNVTLSGTYVCLPHLDTTGPQTEECAFGFKTDAGAYYAVNFGESADAMQQFMAGAHITAEGFTVIKEAVSTNQWDKYNMEGFFTITRVIASDETSSPAPAPAQGKLNINAICEGALAYMTFPNGAAADAFVAECKEGKHPEVIEQYKVQTGVGSGVAI